MNLSFFKYQGTGNDFIILDIQNDKIISRTLIFEKRKIHAL